MSYHVKYLSLVCSLFLNTADLTFASENGVYVWQRSWNTELRDSIKVVENCVSIFLVLGGNFSCEDGKIRFKKVDVNWDYFGEKANVVMVFRVSSDYSSLLGNENSWPEFSRYIADFITAGKQKVNIAGLQLDYDCPTSKLTDYSKFLGFIKRQFPDCKISITALPTWLDSNEFLNLAKETDYYVMQLYSFEPPKTINDEAEIFLKDNALSWIESADKIGRPFYIALPTYGYEIIFGADGRFIGFKAEHEPLIFKEKIQVRTVSTSPDEIISFLDGLKTKRLKKIRGVFWFRLPVESDEFNWDIKTFLSVLSGKIPNCGLKAYLDEKENGLLELYLENTGERNISSEVSFNVAWSGDAPYYDVIGGFRAQSIKNGIKIVGKAPKAGKKVLAAWFKNTRDNKSNLMVGAVDFIAGGGTTYLAE